MAKGKLLSKIGTKVGQWMGRNPKKTVAGMAAAPVAYSGGAYAGLNRLSNHLRTKETKRRSLAKATVAARKRRAKMINKPKPVRLATATKRKRVVKRR